MAEYFEDGQQTLPGHHSLHHHDPSNSTYASHSTDVDEYPMTMQRSLTHGSSHQSHAANTHVSTQSWVPHPSHYVDVHRPPPRESVISEHTQTPFYGPRPLPDPHHQPRRPIHYADPIEDDEEEEERYGYQDVDPHSAPPMQYGYHPTDNDPEMGGHGLVPQQNLLAPPSPQFSDLGQVNPRPKKSLVGGFVKGLKRAFGGGGGTRKRNGKLVRKNTFGTDRTGGTNTTVTQMTTGNTLPRYLSNPSIGPSNPQFAHRLSMAVANGSLPANASPAVFQPLRDVSIPGTFPSVMVTPPSDAAIEEEDDMYYNEPPTNDQPQYNQHEYNQHEYPMQMEESPPQPIGPSPMERTTVLTYGTSTEPPPSLSRAHSQAPSTIRVPVHAPAPAPVPVPSPASGPPLTRQNATRGPRVSYASTPVPHRSNAGAQTEFPLPPIQSSGYITPPPSPRAANISINRRGTPLAFRSQRLGVTSPPCNSRYTMTTAASYYDPSFASDLTPVEKFFKGLNNLPWVSRRVTVDYRPKDSKKARTRGTRSGGWYKNLVARSLGGSRDLDLMSSELYTGTTETETERVMSGSIVHTLSLLASPNSGRSRGSSNNRHHHHHHHKKTSKQKHRRRRRRTADTMTDIHTQRSMSPLVPTMYPYTYPSFPYVYPYAPYPNPQAYPPTSPKGPRTRHRSREKEQKYAQPQAQYPYGYAPGYGQGYGYQPMVAPPGLPQGQAPPGPIYFITPSPPQSQTEAESHAHSRGQTQAEAQKRGQPMALPLPQYAGMPMQMPLQMSPVVMQFVPGYGPHGHAGGMASPPITPRRTSAKPQHQHSQEA